MANEGLKPLAFYSRIDDSDKRQFRENVACLSSGVWLTPRVVPGRGSATIELLDPQGDAVGRLMAKSVESIAVRIDLGWTIRILSHQHYYLRDEDGEPDPDKVSFTLLVFAYPPDQEDHMAPQLARAAELIATTGRTLQMESTRSQGLLNIEFTPEESSADLTSSAAGCASVLVTLWLILLLASRATL